MKRVISLTGATAKGNAQPKAYGSMPLLDCLRTGCPLVWCSILFSMAAGPLSSAESGSRPAEQGSRQSGQSKCQQGVAGKEAKVVTAGERDDSKEVALALSDTLEIRLSSVPGTGYGWKLVGPPPDFLCLDNERLDLGGAAAAGAPAISIFRLVPVRRGTGVIRLHYIRVWEKGVPPKKTYTLPVRVR